MKIDGWVTAGLLIFLVLFFGKIAVNKIEYDEYKQAFAAECEMRGGVVFIPQGVEGWPKHECRRPEAMIDIDI